MISQSLNAFLGKQIQNKLIVFLTFAIVFYAGLFDVQAEGKLQQNFKQAEIKTVIEAVAKVTRKNFIIDPRVKGKGLFP